MSLVFVDQIKWMFLLQLLWANTMVMTPNIHISMVQIPYMTFTHKTYIYMWPLFTGTAYTFSNLNKLSFLYPYPLYHMYGYAWVPKSSYYHIVDIKYIFIKQVSIKGNTLAIMPTYILDEIEVCSFKWDQGWVHCC